MADWLARSTAPWLALLKLPLRVLHWHWALLFRWVLRFLEDENVVMRTIGVAVVAIGLLAVAAGLILPWYAVPIGIVTVSDTETQVVTRNTWFVAPMRACIGIYLIHFFYSLGRICMATDPPWQQWQIASCRWTLVLFVIGASFPGLTMNFDVPLSNHACWLCDQHFNLTWLGGDTYNNQEGQDDLCKTGMIFSGNPLRTGVFAPPDSRGGGLQLSNIELISCWFGYGLGFTQFEERGWLLTVAGTLLIVIGQVRLGMVRRTSRRVVRRIVLVPALVAMAYGVFLCAWVSACGYCLDQARQAHARGKYEPSLAWLDLAGDWLPNVRYHSQFVAQRGYLLLALDQTDAPEALLAIGVERESRGMLAEAEAIYWRIVNDGEQGPSWKWSATRREAFRALVRAGIEDFNSGQIQGAIQTLQALLAICPDHLKSLVVLQYAALQQGKPRECERLANQLQVIYYVFDAPEKRAVLAAVYDNTARAYFVDGNAEKSAEFYRRALKGK